MRNPFISFLKRHGQKYSIERNGEIVFEIDGLPNHETTTGRQYIGFMPGSDVLANDWLINTVGERFYVSDVKTTFVLKEPHCLNAYYLTEFEQQKSLQTGNPTFNIQNAYGSVIGTQSSVILNYNDSIQHLKDQINSTESNDKEELKQLCSLLEMVVNNQVPVQKGLLTKFSAVMERNSWITSAITSTLLGWLTTQIH